MAKIRFETGQVVNFDGNPTPADVEEVATRLGIQKAPTKTKLGDRGLKGVATGVAKAELGLLKGTGQLLQGAGQRLIAGALPKVTLDDVRAKTGFKTLQRGTKEEQRASEVLERQGTAEKVGGAIGDVATFLAPAGAITKGGKAVQSLIRGVGKRGVTRKTGGVLGRAVTEGAGFGGVEALRQGEVGKEAGFTGALGGAFPLVGGIARGTKGLGEVIAGTKGEFALGVKSKLPNLTQQFETGKRVINDVAKDVSGAIGKFQTNSFNTFKTAESKLKDVKIDSLKLSDDLNLAFEDIAGATEAEERLIKKMITTINKADLSTTKGVLETKRFLDKNKFLKLKDGFNVSDKVFLDMRDTLVKALQKADKTFGKASRQAYEDIKFLDTLGINITGKNKQNVELLSNKLKQIAKGLEDPNTRAESLRLLRELEQRTGTKLTDQLQAFQASKSTRPDFPGITEPVKTLGVAGQRGASNIVGAVGRAKQSQTIKTLRKIKGGTKGLGRATLLGGVSQ